MRQESYNNVPALPLDIVINILNNFVNIEPFAYRLSQFNNAALVCRTWYDASRHLIFQNLDGRTVSNLYRIDSLIQPSSSSSSLQQYQHAKHLLSTKVRRLILSFNEFRQGVFFSMDLECAWKTWQLCCARIISTCSCLEFLDIDATGSALPLTCVQLSHAISSRRRLVDFSFTISPSSHPSSHPSSQDDHHRGEQGVLMAAEKEELANENAMIESGEEETHFSPSPSILSNDNGNITSDTYNNMEIDASCRSLKNVTITIKDLLSRSDCIQNMPFCYPSSSNNKEKLAVESLTLVFDLKAPSLIRTVGAHPPSSERSIFLLRKVLGSLLDDGGNYDQLSRPQLEKLVLYHTGSGNRALFLTMVGAALTLLGGQIKSLSIHDVSWTNSLSTIRFEPIPLSIIPYCPNIEQVDITRSRLHAGVFLQYLTRSNSDSDGGDNKLTTLHLSTFELEHNGSDNSNDNGFIQFLQELKWGNNMFSSLVLKLNSSLLLSSLSLETKKRNMDSSRWHFLARRYGINLSMI